LLIRFLLSDCESVYFGLRTPLITTLNENIHRMGKKKLTLERCGNTHTHIGTHTFKNYIWLCIDQSRVNGPLRNAENRMSSTRGKEMEKKTLTQTIRKRC